MANLPIAAALINPTACGNRYFRSLLILERKNSPETAQPSDNDANKLTLGLSLSMDFTHQDLQIVLIHLYQQIKCYLTNEDQPIHNCVIISYFLKDIPFCCGCGYQLLHNLSPVCLKIKSTF